MHTIGNAPILTIVGTFMMTIRPFSLIVSIITALGMVSAVSADSDHHRHNHEHHSLGVHKHGEGMMNIVFEGKSLAIELETPAQNILGFERRPQNEQELEKIKTVAKRLQNPNDMFDIPKEAECVVYQSSVESDLLEEDWDTVDAGDHLDFEAEYELTCNKPEKIKTIGVNLFKEFPDFKEIDVQWINNNEQGAKKLSNKSSKVKL